MLWVQPQHLYGFKKVVLESWTLWCTN